MSDKPTEFQAHVLRVIDEKGPLIASGLGEAIWPDRKFKNAQGAGLAGGGAAGKLVKKGWVKMKYHDRCPLDGRVWPAGYVLTVEGRKALKKA